MFDRGDSKHESLHICNDFITFIIFITIMTKINLYDIDFHDCFGDLGINSPWQVCSFGPSLIRRQVQFCAHFKTIPA